MRKALLLLSILPMLLFGKWEMFTDGVDTYIYNTDSGEIFVRHQRGGENYKDLFVKMNRGVLPRELEESAGSERSQQALELKDAAKDEKERQEELKKRSLELEKKMFDAVFQ